VIAMRGVITGREVAHNAGLIRREFGVHCLLRCFWALASGKQTTFLEIACSCTPEPASLLPWSENLRPFADEAERPLEP
jgi:hypothetical protein